MPTTVARAAASKAGRALVVLCDLDEGVRINRISLECLTHCGPCSHRIVLREGLYGRDVPA